MAQIKPQDVSEFVKLFKEKTKSIFPPQFIDNIGTFLHPSQSQMSQQPFTVTNKLLELNQAAIYHMAQKISDLTEFDVKKSTVSTVRSGTNRIQPKDYQVLEEAVQKAEQEIRKHIGIEHQMKICLEELEDQLDVLTQENDDLKKENQFLKKQLSSTKKKQIQVLKVNSLLTQKLNETESKIQFLEQRFRISKPNSKLLTEPEMMSHENSQTSLKKSFDNYKERQKSSKKQLISKNGGFSKLGSRKTSKVGLLSNEIDVNLNHFMTINTQIKKEAPTKTEGKEVFWNKRLKKKEGATAQGDYATMSMNQPQNRSLNISPRQLKRQQKEKDLKEVYASNTKDYRKSYHPAINEDTITKKKQRRDYSNGDTYAIKKNVIGRGIGFVDRSKSVVY